MSLLVENTNSVFNTEAIRKGFLISAKHKCWEEAKTGIVSAVDQQTIRVLHQPAIANVTCFFEIPVAEVADGAWEIRWSENLSSIEEYVPGGDAGGDA